MKLAASLFFLASCQCPALAADAADLQRAIESACACKVDGVSIAIPSDKSTWRIDYGADVSDAAKAVGAAAISAFDINAPSVPQNVSAMQAKLALSRAGLLGTVQNWIGAQNAEDQLIWSSAPSFSRGSPLLNAAATALGLSQAQLDQLFIAAASINP